MFAINLAQRPPRSPRVRLGGFVMLPRLLDKGRALVAGMAGEYKFNCPLDQLCFEFAGVDAEALKSQLAAGLSDCEMLAWIQQNARHQRTSAEIAAWSAHQEQRAPASVAHREFFHQIHASVAPKREDIATWFDLLDLDDYASFGGKP